MLLLVHVVSLIPAWFTNTFFTWGAAHTRGIYPVQLLCSCARSFPVALLAVRTTNLQINSLVSAVNRLGGRAVVLHERSDCTPLTLMINTCGEWIQAKETCVTFTGKGCRLPHPIRLGTIHHVSPTAFCLKFLDKIITPMLTHCAPWRTSHISLTTYRQKADVMLYNILKRAHWN